MSAFARFLHPTHITRRSYSSFFSSKPGGGSRYFNSAKPPKAVIARSTAKNNGVKAVDSSKESKAEGQTAAGGGSGNPVGGGNAPSHTINATVNQTAQPSSSSSSSPSPSATPSSATSSGVSDVSAASAGTPEQRHSQHQHPVVNAKDFKLHQFFSLHRPLLLLSTPSSILTPAPVNIDLSASTSAPDVTSTHSWLLDEFPEASMDADAAAARQLTRALTINHAGATVAWEDTLRRLGLNVDQEIERVKLQQQWNREWQEVMMDSTKRKRRRKMKKHKSVVRFVLVNPYLLIVSTQIQAEEAEKGASTLIQIILPIYSPHS